VDWGKSFLRRTLPGSDRIQKLDEGKEQREPVNQCGYDLLKKKG